jgi:organic radical activating enzyme
MRIADIQFDIYSRSIKIFTQGCDGVCYGCFNPSLWDFDGGEPYIEKLDNYKLLVDKFGDLIEWIQILGGEPLLNDRQVLEQFLKNVKTEHKLILFTRFELDEVPLNIKEVCDYIKTGKFDDTKKGIVDYYGIKLQSTNQKIWKKEGLEWK